MVKPAPISVIIPTYNGEKFISEAINSVRAQSLPVLEIIVVDDGSTDGTVDVAERLRVRVLRQSNKGVSAARNAGIRAAQNEWIAFIDQDDVWEPQKIERQWTAVTAYSDVGIVASNLTWFQDQSLADQPSGLTDSDAPAITMNSDGSIRYIERVKDELPLSRLYDYTSSVLVRRELLLRVGMFNESLRQNEDLECFLRVIAQGSLAIVHSSLVRRRIHTQNTSLNDPRGATDAYYRILDLLRQHPERYPPGAARAYNDELSRALIATGRELLEVGRAREARELFGESIERARSSRAMILWGLSFLSPPIFKALLNIKRKLF